MGHSIVAVATAVAGLSLVAAAGVALESVNTVCVNTAHVPGGVDVTTTGNSSVLSHMTFPTALTSGTGSSVSVASSTGTGPVENGFAVGWGSNTSAFGAGSWGRAEFWSTLEFSIDVYAHYGFVLRAYTAGASFPIELDVTVVGLGDGLTYFEGNHTELRYLPVQRYRATAHALHVIEGYPLESVHSTGATEFEVRLVPCPSSVSLLLAVAAFSRRSRR